MNDQVKTVADEADTASAEESEANKCIGLGVGVGALGAAGAALSGAVCPICVVVAPALIGAGLIKRRKIRKRKA